MYILTLIALISLTSWKNDEKIDGLEAHEILVETLYIADQIDI